ncbi:MAG: hypothetical protein ABEI74_04215 [Candidatus Pacearchaeota archaeon]
MLDKLKNNLENKKAQGLSRNAIILLVIGVIVLVILIIGFNQGFGKLAPFLSSNNVDSVSQGCSFACSQQNTYSYCSEGRDLNSEDESLKGVTCNYLAKKKPQYPIKTCTQISCDNVKIVELSQGESLKDYCNQQNSGVVLQAIVDGKLKSYNCQSQ